MFWGLDHQLLFSKNGSIQALIYIFKCFATFLKVFEKFWRRTDRPTNRQDRPIKVTTRDLKICSDFKLNQIIILINITFYIFDVFTRWSEIVFDILQYERTFSTFVLLKLHFAYSKEMWLHDFESRVTLCQLHSKADLQIVLIS